MNEADKVSGGGGDWTALYRDARTAADYDAHRFAGRRAWNNRLIGRTVVRELRALCGADWPCLVVDAPAGTGRFTAELREMRARVAHLDRSPAMLARLRGKHGPGMEIVGDLTAPPLRARRPAVGLSLRLMQHLGRRERVAALRGLAFMVERALVAYYPGWHYKNALRHLRHRLGLPHRPLRERLSIEAIRGEVEEAGWRLVRFRRVLPWLSENVLLALERAG